MGIEYRDIPIGLRSRAILTLMRLVAPPMMMQMASSSPAVLAKLQQRVRTLPWPDVPGIAIAERHIGNIPGHVLGDLSDTSRPVALWLHGGAFLLPASNMHLSTCAQYCKSLGIAAFMPDYRLIPEHPYPAGLDDCEQAYHALLELGFAPEKVILIGDSAGGNLIFGLMRRIRKHKLPLPACAIAISPLAELGRAYYPPTLYMRRLRDPLLPLAALPKLAEAYCGETDGSHPELSPLYMKLVGLPPVFILASSNEILMDDAVHLAERCIEAGVETECHVWPRLPHAFPLFERIFPEARQALDEMVEFTQRHLPGTMPGTTPGTTPGTRLGTTPVPGEFNDKPAAT